MDESGIVETWMNDDVSDVELLVPQGFGRRAHVVLAQPDLQDVPDGVHERQTEKINI